MSEPFKINPTTMDAYVVHSAGKVASFSVVSALETAGLGKDDSRIFKTHILNEEGTAIQSHKGAIRVPGHLRQSKEFLDLSRRGEFDHTYVIIGYREPVARAISVFFQNINNHLKKQEVTMADFEEIMIKLKTPHSYAVYIMKTDVLWWKEEVEEVFDVDLFAYDFDVRRGVSVIEPTETLTFVPYNLERGMKHLPGVLETITGSKPITIPVVNSVADEKFGYKTYRNYSEIEMLYKMAIEHLKLPLRKLREAYNLPASRFFYDDEQIAGFIERWCDPAL